MSGLPAGTRLVVVGDALLDRDLDGRVERMAPDAPVPVLEDPTETARPGGAALAASLAAADGTPVTLITAIAPDAAGRQLAGLLAGAGVEVIDLGLRGRTAEKIRLRTTERPLLRLDRGGPPAPIGPLTAAARLALRSAAAVLVSDYGRGVAADPGLCRALGEAAHGVPLVWDPHPLGAQPVAGTLLATPNRAEATAFVPDVAGDDVPSIGRRAEALAERWEAGHVCVTLGGEGAVLAGGGEPPAHVPAVPARGGDPCGAGDRFASRAAALLAGGGSVAGAVRAAVQTASAFVAAGGASAASPGAEGRAPEAPPPPPEGIEAIGRLLAAVRSAGGTVVATGGCFDLLHAGHVATLEAARALGDWLVVLMNSDDSVRRLKGSDRPLVEQGDRAAVLGALRCVDAVVIFDEDTPAATLERLRPDVFVKGGDYEAEGLPETAVVERFGGRVVILPYVAGRSTTRLIEEVALRGVA